MCIFCAEQRRVSENIHTCTHTQCERVLHAEILLLDGTRGGASNRRPSCSGLLLEAGAPSLLIVHRTFLRLVGEEGGGVKGRSSPPQLNAAVHQLRCHSNRLLPRRRTHSLLPVPAQYGRHRLAEAVSVLRGTRGEVSAFVRGTRGRLCVGVCVNSSGNMADFLIGVVQRGTAALQAGCSGAAQRRGESLVADGNPQTGQTLLRVRLHLWATGVLLRYAFLPGALAVAPAVALA